jgi:hypothetical protein
VLAAAGLLLLGAAVADACNTPVFRVALIDPAWRPERYEFTLFHKGPLPEPDKTILKGLNDYLDKHDDHVNCRLQVVDLDRKPSKDSVELFRNQSRAGNSPFGFAATGTDLGHMISSHAVRLPYLVVRHPEVQEVMANLWAGPLCEAPLRGLLESPARAELSGRILEGQSAVWVFLESGDQTQDEPALALLTAQLRKLEQTLKLPELKPGENYKYDREGAPPVKLEFSTLRLSRADAAEKWFIEMLLLTEDDLKASRQPMVFPVFGRGIALYALVGKGINEKTIATAARFLVGECACELRRDNPGKDLLMVAPWETGRPLPAVADLLFMPLASVGRGQGKAADTGAEAVGVPVVEEPGEAQKGSADNEVRLFVNIAGGLAVGLLIIVGCGIFYAARGRA